VQNPTFSATHSWERWGRVTAKAVQHIIQESTDQQTALRKITDKATSKVDHVEMGQQHVEVLGLP